MSELAWKSPGRSSVRYAVTLSATAVLTHYVWESLHCPLFVHPPGDTPMWMVMIRAALGDAGLTWIAQLAMAVLTGRWIWPRAAGWRSWGLLVVLAVGMAVAVETYALAAGRWSYAPANPVIAGLDASVLPVAQLVILLPLSFVTAGFAAARVGPDARPAGARRA